MRIFAFGGNRYAERARVGEWPADFADTVEFEDVFALPFGRRLLAYGVGVRDATPVLVVRERQSEEDRGGYAYTVLLDPGAEIWKRFDYNAARLLLAAQRHAAFWTELLTSPSTLASPDIVRDRLDALDPHPATGQPTVPGSLITKVKVALVGSMLGPAPLAVHVSELGVAGRLDVPQMAVLLDALPPAFRIGFGWLMGGNPATAPKFGCRLVVDDVSEGPAANAHAVMALGAEAVYALEVVAGQQLSAALPPLLEQPAHVWDVEPSRLVEQCRVLVALSTGAAEDVAVALAAIAPSDLLHDDVLKAIVQAITTSPAAPAPAVADWALAAYGGATRIPPEIAQRTDAATLARHLLAAGVTLASPSVRHYKLPSRTALEVWRAQLAVEEPSRVPGLLREAVGHLTRGSPDRVDRTFAVELARVAIDRTTTAGRPLREWCAADGDVRLWPVLSEVLEGAVRRTLAPGDESWALDYLCCARDPGGAWLAEQVGIASLEEVAHVALAFLRDRVFGGAARDWLDALAESPVRPELSIPLKLQIADSASGRWLPLAQLCQLLRGEKFLPGRPPDPAQARFLNIELTSLVAGGVRGIPPAGGVVDLKPILTLVGGTISAEVAFTLAHRFTLDADGLRWLRAHHAASFDTVVKREWRELPSELLDHIAEGTILELLGEIRTLDGRERQLRDVRRLAATAPPSALASAIQRQPDVQSWLAALIGDRSVDVLVADEALAAMPVALRRQILTRLNADAPELFSDLVARLVSADAAPASGRTVFDFIAGDAALRTQIARSLFGQPSWRGAESILESRLCGEAARNEDPHDEDGPSESTNTPKRPSVLQRLFNTRSSSTPRRARSSRRSR